MGMSDHTSAIMGKDEWLTPPYILNALGDFDLDPCAPINRPWNTAKKHLTIEDNGLVQDWGDGVVWCNPPYGRECVRWLRRLSNHNNGVALVFARTETKMFFSEVWCKASSVLFLKGRLHFHHVDGSEAVMNSGAPSVLISYGDECKERLRWSGLKGKFIQLK